MREITNNSKNKLASRLYRNSSLNHVNSSTSMLSSFAHDIEPSFLNSSSSNSQLIASISLKKLKKKVISYSREVVVLKMKQNKKKHKIY